MKNFFFSIVVVAFVSYAFSVGAIGPRNVTSSGLPVKWSSVPITVHLESDTDVRGKEVLTLIQEALTIWSDLSESAVTFTQDSLGEAVDDGNVCCFVFDASACPDGPTSDGTNPIVIDEDGEITASFFGTGNKFTTLGFASVITFSSVTGAAVKGEAVFNASCLAGEEVSGCERDVGVGDDLSFSDDDFTSFIVHEIGHFLGLDHSQVNLTEATDGDSSNNDLITTMFPTFIVGNGASFKTPARDDEVALAQLYPSATFDLTTWTITGTVFEPGGATELQCANVIARNEDDPRVDAISALSGDFSPSGSEVGDYEIPGLTPGETYTVEVESIDSDFTGASGYTPCRGSSGESDPPQFTSATHADTFSRAAGATESGVNFTVSDLSSLVLQEASSAVLAVSLSTQEQAVIAGDIAAIEMRSQTSDSCESGGSGSSSGSGGSGGGCSLVPALDAIRSSR